MKNLVKLLSVILIAIGAGLLLYGVTVKAEDYRAPAGLDHWLATPAESAAWGIGMLVGGALFMVMFARKGSAKDK